jgi:hypothetical protein
MTGGMPPLANAACRDPQTAHLFATRVGGARIAERAAAVCNGCWDRPECLAWGIDHENSGIWGGHGSSGLKRLRQQFGVTLHEITGGHSLRGDTP